MNEETALKQALEATGAAIGDIRDKQGNLLVANRTPRQRYYTPDGREQWKIPQHRTRSDGVVYDIFLAQGYLLTPPEKPKLYCPGCDNWHDTEEEVDACVKAKAKFKTSMFKKAEQELAKEQKGKDKAIAELEAKVDKLTKLLEAKLGKEI